MSSKKLVSILMALLLLFQVAAVAGAENQKGLEAGTYHSEQRGHNEMINFEITLNQDGIEKIEVVESAETPGVSDKALYKDYPNLKEKKTILYVPTFRQGKSVHIYDLINSERINISHNKSYL